MAGIPKKYAFLSSIGVLPKMVTNALALLGTNEVPGKGSSAVIMAWRDELAKAGVNVAGYSDDSVPWCGLFVALVALRSGKEVVENPLWARNWAKFGIPVKQAYLGDVLVFQRPGGGGHVGLYIAEDATAYHVLGGNQSDSVTITRILKSRCVAIARPIMNVPPNSLKPYRIAADGSLSQNEA